MNLHVFNVDTFERLGIIDIYQEQIFRTNYRAHSELEMIVDATPKNIDWLVTQIDDVFLTTGVDVQRGYLIESFDYDDESSASIKVYCKSISIMLNWRHIERQTNYSGNVERVMRKFVEDNAISPSNSKRKIANLVFGPISGVGSNTTISYNGDQLDEALWDMAIKHDITYDIFADIPNKRFVFKIWQGTDRTTEQTQRDAVIFAKEFDNVLHQNYQDDKTLYRNTVYVAGAGEGSSRQIVTVNDAVSGRHRRELYVDARDLQDTEQQTVVTINDDGEETETTETVQMNPTQYRALLVERGESKKAEYERVQAFETGIDYNSQFKYGFDYTNGDKVTIRNDEIGIVMHTRVVATKETYKSGGYDLEIEFGSNVPTLLDSIKKKVVK